MVSTERGRMQRMGRPARTVLEVCVARLGMRRGTMAAVAVVQWAIATDEFGRVPTTVEYSEWWAVTERTGWSNRATVRAVFGDDWQVVVQEIADHIDDRRSRKEVMALPVRSRFVLA